MIGRCKLGRRMEEEDEGEEEEKDDEEKEEDDEEKEDEDGEAENNEEEGGVDGSVPEHEDGGEVAKDAGAAQEGDGQAL